MKIHHSVNVAPLAVMGLFPWYCFVPFGIKKNKSMFCKDHTQLFTRDYDCGCRGSVGLVSWRYVQRVHSLFNEKISTSLL